MGKASKQSQHKQNPAVYTQEYKLGICLHLSRTHKDEHILYNCFLLCLYSHLDTDQYIGFNNKFSYNLLNSKKGKLSYCSNHKSYKEIDRRNLLLILKLLHR